MGADKLQRLKETLQPLLQEGLVVAYSGGVDSSFLLWVAEQVRREYGGRLLALTANSASVPRWELQEAISFARHCEAEHLIVESHEVENPEYAKNDERRCYYCKSELFNVAWQITKQRGYGVVAYGYTASDRGDVRPGHEAAREQKVLFPLETVGFEKEEIREILKKAGLSLAEKPASPCLASRVMQGVTVSAEKLADIEALEGLLRGAGLRVFRVRLHEEGVIKYLRLEVDAAEMSYALSIKDTLVDEGQKRGYCWVTLDLAGYCRGGASTRNKL